MELEFFVANREELWPQGTPLFSRASKPLLRRLLKRGEALSAVAGKARVLHEEDGNQAALRINVHVGRKGAAVAEGAVAGGPAQAVAFLDGFAGLLARHLLHGVFREEA